MNIKIAIGEKHDLWLLESGRMMWYDKNQIPPPNYSEGFSIFTLDIANWIRRNSIVFDDWVYYYGKE